MIIFIPTDPCSPTLAAKLSFTSSGSQVTQEADAATLPLAQPEAAPRPSDEQRQPRMSVDVLEESFLLQLGSCVLLLKLTHLYPALGPLP